MEGVQMTVNPEIIDMTEENSVKEMKALFGCLRKAIGMMTDPSSVTEEDAEVLDVEMTEHYNKMMAGFAIFETVFGVSIGAGPDEEETE